MRNPVPLLALLLIAWLGFGAYFYQQNCCISVASISSPLLIKDGAAMIASHPENLRFGLSNDQAIVPPKIEAEFKKVADYLGSNPSKTLSLVGQYGASEKYGGKLANLGVARAEDVKKYLLGLGAVGIAASQIATSGEINNELAVEEEHVFDGIRYNFTTLAAPSKTISITDASAFTAGANDNLVFGQNEFKYDAPLTDKLTAVYEKTATYLKAHPERSIQLTGFYGEEEKNTSAFPSLGLARANVVKDLFIGMGVSAKQIKMEGVSRTDLVFSEEKLIGGLSYEFFDTPKVADDRLPRVEKMLKANPLLLYFPTSVSELKLSAEQRNYFADLIYYLDNKAKARVQVVGHTDDRGNPAGNVRLSRKRAEFVRDYLVKNGIAVNKISVSSKGPDEPIDTNETEAGRQKNRRVEISIR